MLDKVCIIRSWAAREQRNKGETKMTKTQITKAQEKANVKFQLAIQIRELLDAAKKQYGSQDWEDDDMESEVLDLVSGE